MTVISLGLVFYFRKKDICEKALASIRDHSARCLHSLAAVSALKPIKQIILKPATRLAKEKRAAPKKPQLTLLKNVVVAVGIEPTTSRM
jgi:hypothetical protein